MPNTGCEPLRPLTASCSLLAVSLPTDAEDWITTKRRHLYGNPQGNIGGPLPGLPSDQIDPACARVAKLEDLRPNGALS
jgi:hypothetical protein